VWSIASTEIPQGGEKEGVGHGKAARPHGSREVISFTLEKEREIRFLISGK
jgi:hypothetical protein